eukprot:CAMPEP_0174890894 /NCGR_PEP_ID=MMETSP0167-20121228/5999_1 /TAXON_ID=38298 /ORGANISM="Rhodella maculata, Strain CCMP736" /LENGTH=73 /DNA_ID=CAMNT_0016128867 /DNA_START=205 /DNA_END=423 /DNA_ORIENTATION=-
MNKFYTVPKGCCWGVAALNRCLDPFEMLHDVDCPQLHGMAGKSVVVYADKCRHVMIVPIDGRTVPAPDLEDPG